MIGNEKRWLLIRHEDYQSRSSLRQSCYSTLCPSGKVEVWVVSWRECSQQDVKNHGVNQHCSAGHKPVRIERSRRRQLSHHWNHFIKEQTWDGAMFWDVGIKSYAYARTVVGLLLLLLLLLRITITKLNANEVWFLDKERTRKTKKNLAFGTVHQFVYCKQVEFF